MMTGAWIFSAAGKVKSLPTAQTGLFNKCEIGKLSLYQLN
jgi:hypothetical protein